MSAVPLGFVLVVGLGVFLLAVLQILQLAYVVDAARSVRAAAHNTQRMSEILQEQAAVAERAELRALEEAA